MFDNIYNLDTVPIATVQVRFDGWVTEMENEALMMDTTTIKTKLCLIGFLDVVDLCVL